MSNHNFIGMEVKYSWPNTKGKMEYIITCTTVGVSQHQAYVHVRMCIPCYCKSYYTTLNPKALRNSLHFVKMQSERFCLALAIVVASIAVVSGKHARKHYIVQLRRSGPETEQNLMMHTNVSIPQRGPRRWSWRAQPAQCALETPSPTCARWARKGSRG